MNYLEQKRQLEIEPYEGPFIAVDTSTLKEKMEEIDWKNLSKDEIIVRTIPAKEMKDGEIGRIRMGHTAAFGDLVQAHHDSNFGLKDKLICLNQRAGKSWASMSKSDNFRVELLEGEITINIKKGEDLK